MVLFSILTDVFGFNVELVGLFSSFIFTFIKIDYSTPRSLSDAVLIYIYYCLINFISCFKGTKEKRSLLKTTALEKSDSLCLSKPFFCSEQLFPNRTSLLFINRFTEWTTNDNHHLKINFILFGWRLTARFSQICIHRWHVTANGY